MKKYVPLAMCAAFLLAGQVLAFSPIPGFYVGVLADIYHGPNNRTAFTLNNNVYQGVVNYEPVGGGGGAAVGYRIKQFRIEGELMYNYIAAKTLQTGNCTLQSPTMKVPNQSCPNSSLSLYGFNGDTSGYYGMANFYYDFMRDSFDVSVVPYVGLGLGYTKLTERLNFVLLNNTGNTITSSGASFIGGASAAQAIAGLNLFIDDYTWAGMDLRYITTGGLSAVQNSRYAVFALNFVINFSLDRGYPK